MEASNFTRNYFEQTQEMLKSIDSPSMMVLAFEQQIKKADYSDENAFNLILEELRDDLFGYEGTPSSLKKDIDFVSYKITPDIQLAVDLDLSSDTYKKTSVHIINEKKDSAHRVVTYTDPKTDITGSFVIYSNGKNFEIKTFASVRLSQKEILKRAL